MTGLYVTEPSLFPDCADVVRLFSGEKHLQMLEEPIRGPGACIHVVSGPSKSRVCLFRDGTLEAECEDETVFLPLGRTPERERKRQIKHRAKRALYRVLSQRCERQLPWGALTGIRPVHLFRELTSCHGRTAAEREFADSYFVCGDRVGLAGEIMQAQEPFVPGGPEACMYVGIPFCPSRCAYCSFIAQDIKSAMQVRDLYLDALLTELAGVSFFSSPISSVYVGGGTPTTLTEGELDRLLNALRLAAPELGELTVEAGRPDTVTESKLQILRRHLVSRISINPQTLNDVTLRTIGRDHTSADFHRAMDMARRYAGWDINTDIIVGLPGEDLGAVMHTLDGVLPYAPENVTVHSLAVKNAARLASSSDWERLDPDNAQTIMDAVRLRLKEAGYVPYYLYRQKYMSGNLENIGFTLPGHACRYNMQHMEEWASVLAVGSGSISKRISPADQRIERAANVKDAAQYVKRVEEMIERKRKLFNQEK